MNCCTINVTMSSDFFKPHIKEILEARPPSKINGNLYIQDTSTTADLWSVQIFSAFLPHSVRFFRESVAGRVKQSPQTLQQLEALATS